MCILTFYQRRGSFSYAKPGLCLPGHTVLRSADHMDDMIRYRRDTRSGSSYLSGGFWWNSVWNLLASCHPRKYSVGGIGNTHLCRALFFLKGLFPKCFKRLSALPLQLISRKEIFSFTVSDQLTTNELQLCVLWLGSTVEQHTQTHSALPIRSSLEEKTQKTRCRFQPLPAPPILCDV